MEFPVPFNLAEYFLDHNLKRRADKVAVYYRDETWTYKQVYEQSCRFANAARALGVRQEDRVLIILPDSPAFVFTIMGVHKVGGVVTMVNPRLPTEDLAYYFNYTKAPLAVIPASLVEAIEQILPELTFIQNILVVGQEGEDDWFLPFEATLAEQKPEFENAPTHPNDPAVWLFTSGTSGKPKAAVHLQHDFAFNTEKYCKQVLALNENDRTISVPKLFFGYATGTNLWFPFAVGGSTVLFDEHATPDVLFDNIERYKPTFLTTVPTMINKMLQSPRCQTSDLTSLRLGVSAGEKLPAELYSRWLDRCDVEILDGIGSAEMFHIYITNYRGDVRVGTLGKLVPGYEARIVDGDGHDVPPGEVGTLWIKGDSMMTCYFQDSERSKDRLRGEWLNTCDMFRLNADGYFIYEGRADDMLKVGGIFVSPGEIENCLMQHPAVRECAVIGCSDDSELVRAKAFVVVNDGHDGCEKLSADLIAFAKEKMARYKAPSWIEYMAALPRNDRGKVARNLLK